MSEQMIGRYQILEKVGRGGMGVLYRGTDPVLDREVAIKVMSGEFADGDDDARERFFREARAAARLQHRNIVTIYEFAEEDGVPYIVMEFLRGRSLATRLAAEPRLTVSESLDIITQLCTGLQFAHDNGVVHRDVKPGNVWLLDDGGIKLLDFGIAKLASSTFTRQGNIVGSASYMAPEQVSSKPVDGRADIFSAGVVLYEMLAGRRPFEADSPTAALLKIVQEEPERLDRVSPGLPKPLLDALDKALKKNPDDRYQAAADFGADLQIIRMGLHEVGEGARPAAVGTGDTIRSGGTGTTTVAMPAAEAMLTARDEMAPNVPRRSPVRTATIAIVVIAAAVGAWVMLQSLRPTAPPGAVPAQALVQQPTNTAAVPPPSQPTAPVTTNAAATRTAATLRITSDPPGAAINIDGRDTGLVTPADIRVEGAAPKRIRLSRAGYRTLDARLSPRALSEGVASYTLPAEAEELVSVTVSGSYSFQVFDGGREISGAKDSHDLRVPVAHIIRLRADAYLLDYPIKVSAGADHTMEIRAPELGRVTIRSSMETCHVFLGSFDLGYPPIAAQPVAAGTYGVQLKCPDGQIIHSAAITVVAGQTLMVKVP